MNDVVALIDVPEDYYNIAEYGPKLLSSTCD
jgi:hypothetical protein